MTLIVVHLSVIPDSMVTVILVDNNVSYEAKQRDKAGTYCVSILCFKFTYLCVGCVYR